VVGLTAVILTLNEAAHIVGCIRSLEWAGRILVFDSFSSDDTVELARSAGAEVWQHPFENYARQRNAALDRLANAEWSTEWVFFVDADERGTPQLGQEIHHVIATRPESAWFVPRHNYIFGRLTRGAGWFPDYQLRLLRHGRARYRRPVHEVADVEGETGYLQNPLIHLNYHNPAQFHAKQRAYSDRDARLLKAEGVRPRPHNFILQPLRQFWWRFVSLRGYRDGLHGLRLSLLLGYYEWVKYVQLRRLWQDAVNERGD
jgi:glycosyltransferase involved in cell wall biosynthesis